MPAPRRDWARLEPMRPGAAAAAPLIGAALFGAPDIAATRPLIALADPHAPTPIPVAPAPAPPAPASLSVGVPAPAQPAAEPGALAEAIALLDAAVAGVPQRRLAARPTVAGERPVLDRWGPERSAPQVAGRAPERPVPSGEASGSGGAVGPGADPGVKGADPPAAAVDDVFDPIAAWLVAEGRTPAPAGPEPERAWRYTLAQSRRLGLGAELARAGDAAELARPGDAAELARAGDAAELARPGDAAAPARAGDAAALARPGDAAAGDRPAAGGEDETVGRLEPDGVDTGSPRPGLASAARGPGEVRMVGGAQPTPQPAAPNPPPPGTPTPGVQPPHPTAPSPELISPETSIAEESAAESGRAIPLIAPPGRPVARPAVPSPVLGATPHVEVEAADACADYSATVETEGASGWLAPADPPLPPAVPSRSRSATPAAAHPAIPADPPAPAEGSSVAADEGDRVSVAAAIASLPTDPVPTTEPARRRAGALAYRARLEPDPMAAPAAVPTGAVNSFARMTGIDLGFVPLRRGPEVSVVARESGARAFTRGGAVHLPSEDALPDTAELEALLAHELTHVAQQRVLGARACETGPLGAVLEAQAAKVEHAARAGSEGPAVVADLMYLQGLPDPAGNLTGAEPGRLSWMPDTGFVPTAQVPAALEPQRAPWVPALPLEVDPGPASEPEPAPEEAVRIGARRMPAPDSGEGVDTGEDPLARGLVALTRRVDELAKKIAKPTASAAAKPDLDALAASVCDRVSNRIRADLVIERERAGRLYEFR